MGSTMESSTAAALTGAIQSASCRKMPEIPQNQDTAIGHADRLADRRERRVPDRARHTHDALQRGRAPAVFDIGHGHT
jgi:hypothetical protein